jgi:threonine/homoserine/homoserine lactone efflux protein
MDGPVGFLLLVVALSVTPGPDDVLVLRATLRGGTRLGVATTLGIATGTAVWGAAAALGLAALVAGSTALHAGLQLAGGGYLVALGLLPAAEWARTRGRVPVAAGAGGAGEPLADGRRPGCSTGRAFALGMAGDLLNPRIGLFYVVVVPAFVPSGGPALQWSLLLCAIDLAVAVAWLLALTCGATAARRWLTRPGAAAVLQWLLSGTLVGLGIASALG